MVLCVGLIPQGDRGRGSFQEFDNHARFGSIVEKVLVLNDAVHTTRTRTHDDLRRYLHRRLVPAVGLAPMP